MKRFPQLLLLLLLVALGAGARNDREERNRAAATAKSDVLYYCSQENQESANLATQYLQARVSAALNSENIHALADMSAMHLLQCDHESQMYKDSYAAVYNAYMSDPDCDYGQLLYDLSEDPEETLALARTMAERADDERAWAVYALSLKSVSKGCNRPELTDSARCILEAMESRYGLTHDVVYVEFLMLLDEEPVDTARIVGRVSEFAAIAPENLILAEELMEVLGRSDSAMAYAERACEQLPDYLPMREKRANLYLMLDDSARFFQYASELIVDPMFAAQEKQSMIETVVDYFKETPAMYDSIASILGTYASQYPDDELPWLNYANLLIRIDRPLEAIEPVKYVLSTINSESWYGYLLMSVAYINMDSIEQATATCRQCYALDPTEGTVVLQTANEMMIRGQFQPALDLMSIVEEDSIEAAAADILYNFRGNCYNEIEEYDRAIECYRKSLEINPDNALTANNMAYMMAEHDIGDLNEAEELACRAVNAEPGNYTSYDTYAWVQFKQCRFSEARRSIEHTIELLEAENSQNPEEADESDAVIYDHAGDIYFMNGLYDEALAMWQKALSLSPEDKNITLKVKYKTIIHDVDE